jgi:hypothetical protein
MTIEYLTMTEVNSELHQGLHQYGRRNWILVASYLKLLFEFDDYLVCFNFERIVFVTTVVYV